MRIRTQLVAAAASAAVVAVLVLLGLLHVTRLAAEANRAQADTHAVAREVTGLLALTLEYTLYGGERPTEQWRARHAQLSRTVAQAMARSPEPAPTLLALQRAVEPLPALFDRLEEIDHGDAGSLGDRRKQFLIERLMTEMQEVAEARYRWAVAIGEEQAREQRLFAGMVIGAPVVLLAMILALALLVGRRVLLPLARLQAAADAVRGGQADVPIDSRAPDELGDMARAFAAMTLAIGQKNRAVETANAALVDEVARRQSSEQTLRKVTDSVPAFMSRVDAALCYTFVNGVVARAFGGEETMLGRSIREVSGEAAWAQLAPHALRALGGEPATFEFRDDASGRSGWFQSSYIPEFDAAGRPCGFFAITFDVSERKRSELRLQELAASVQASERRLRAVADNLPAQIAHVDADERYLFCNAAVARVLGAAPEALLGRSLREVRGAAFYAGIEAHVKRALAGETVDFEIVSSRSGAPRTYQSTFIPDLDASGAVRGFYSMSFDITDRKTAEARLRTSEAQLRTVMESSPLAIFMTDAAGACRYVNPAWQRTSGLGVEAALGDGWQRAVHPEDLPRALRFWRGEDASQNGTVTELRWVRPDGTIRWMRRHAAELRDGDVLLGRVGIAEDVTDRRELDAALYASQQRLQLVMDNVPALISYIDAERRYRLVNHGYEEWHGLAAAQIVGRAVSEFYTAEQSHTYEKAMDRAFAGETVSFDLELLHGGRLRALNVNYIPERDDGGAVLGIYALAHDVTELRRTEQQLRTIMESSPLGMFISDPKGACLYVNPGWERIAGLPLAQARGAGWLRVIHPDDQPSIQERFMRSQATGEIVVSEHRYLHPDGSMRWVRGHAAPLMQGAQLLGHVGTVEDITERRALDAELTARTAELARSNADLEQFAYVASHDLQEPLRMVSSYTQLLMRRHADKLDGDAREFMGFIEDGAKRAQALIGDLLSLARVNSQGKPFAPVPLAEVLEEVLSGLRLLIADADADVSHDAGLPVLLADRRQLGQLLQNLIANALKFRAPGRRAEVRLHAAREADGRWRIAVADNGIGIEPRFFERVFVMFQRLHLRGEYPGTGIGLAICKKVVERHGGRIGVESVPGQGSSFWFTMAEAVEAVTEAGA